MQDTINSNYKNALDQLNPEQLKAVETIYGPLMVVAGPGTGKTQLLSTRIGFILKNTDADYQNILCMTFTNAGVSAIKQRLMDIIGSESHQIEVNTFNGFAEKIIRDFEFNTNSVERRVLDDLNKKKILKKVISKVDFGSPLLSSYGGIPQVLTYLSNLFDVIKSENYKPELLIELLKQDLEDSKTRDEFLFKRNSGEYKKDELNPRLWNEYEKKVTRSIQGIELFEDYQSLLKEGNFYELNDQVKTAIQILQDNPDYLYTLRERYQYVMLDEFQDTNGAQLDLAKLICEPSEEPNIMIVGDEDQSIYKFQGANIDNFWNFYTYYLKNYSTQEQLERIIVLKNNYRSNENIVEASKKLIEVNQQRITSIIEGHSISKNFISALDKAYKKPAIELIESDSKQAELISIAEKVKELIEVEKVQAGSIAILCNTRKDIQDVSEYLRINHIDFQMSYEENLAEDNFIIGIMSFIHLGYLFLKEKELNKDVIGDIMLRPWAQINSLDLSIFWLEYQKSGLSFFEFVKKGTIPDSTTDFFNKINQIISQINEKSTQNFLFFALDTFKVNTWILEQENRLDLFQKIHVLSEFIQENAQERESFSIIDFWDLFKEYQVEEIAIPYVKYYLSKDSVNLMTLHKSKGLQFDTVIIYNTGKFTNKRSQIHLIDPNTDSKRINENDTDIEEKRRLLYVGMTRAENRLILTNFTTEDAKNINPFLADIELIDSMDNFSPKSVIRVDFELTNDLFLKYESASKIEIQALDSRIYENDYVNFLINDFHFSHSSINTYLDCPYKFFLEKILRYPSSGKSSIYLIQGNIAHNVLESFYKKAQTDQATPNATYLMELVDIKARQYKNDLTEQEYTDSVRLIKQNLKKYSESEYFKFNDYSYIIEDYVKLDWDGIHLSGKIDYYHINPDNTLDIVDYKSGALKKEKLSPYQLEPLTMEYIQSLKDIDLDKAYGGDYWRQAILYKILLETKNPAQRVENIYYQFLVKNQEREKVVITPQDEEYLKTLIKFVSELVKKKDFHHCMKPDCWACNSAIERKELDD